MDLQHVKAQTFRRRDNSHLLLTTKIEDRERQPEAIPTAAETGVGKPGLFCDLLS